MKPLNETNSRRYRNLAMIEKTKRYAWLWAWRKMAGWI